jgi:hypothetical protein
MLTHAMALIGSFEAPPVTLEKQQYDAYQAEQGEQQIRRRKCTNFPIFSTSIPSSLVLRSRARGRGPVPSTTNSNTSSHCFPIYLHLVTIYN